MKIRKVKKRYEGTYVLDEDTGEILTIVPDDKPKVRNAPFNLYVGEDVKYPSMCVTKDHLEESLRVIDSYLGNPVMVNSHYLMDAVIQRLITPQELSLIHYIAHNVFAWNYYIGNVKDLTNSGIDTKHLSGVIKKLSPYTLRVLHKDKPFRGDIVIKINPAIAWKGDVSYRSNRVETWYCDFAPFFGD